ncbi:transposase [Sphingomonas pseudosanguinis]|jgi:transposase|uniref:Transposase n=1 Tax=Sphingomonas pseudosanguinis TaxID=413712 RepID=A0A7W6F3J7_9SPHN|nr:transposase [Sphingomonas pseudosanguinis]
MSDLYWLTDEQMARLEPYFPKSHGKPRVDDRRVLSGIVFVNRNGLRWCDAPREYGPHKTLYNGWKRWGERGVFLRIMEGLAAASATPKTIMIDATYLKAHRTASSLRVKRMARPVGKRFVSDVLSSLRKRIRPFDARSLAKMEIRASWSS